MTGYARTRGVVSHKEAFSLQPRSAYFLCNNLLLTDGRSVYMYSLIFCYIHFRQYVKFSKVWDEIYITQAFREKILGKSEGGGSGSGLRSRKGMDETRKGVKN